MSVPGTRRALAMAMALGLLACGDDGGADVAGPGELVGAWTLSVWEYSLAADPAQKVDWVVSRGLTGSLDVGADGSFSVVPALDGGTGSDSGQLTVEGSSIFWDGQNDEEWVDFELVGSTLTLYWPETSFVDMDQNGEPEDAWLRVVFERP